MGFFREETEEERLYKQLRQGLRTSSINETWKDYLLFYIENVYEGHILNDFYDWDFLSRVIISTIDMEDLDSKNPDEVMSKLKEHVRFIFTNGKDTENYDVLKETFINNYCGYNGFIEKKLLSKSNLSFMSLFTNFNDYLKVMNLISKSELAVKNMEAIYDYAINVSPYCTSDDVFKGEVISFIQGLDSLLGEDINEYKKERLIVAQKRCGIYPVDEKTLAAISQEAEKAQALVIRLGALQKKVDGYEQSVATITKEGKASLTKVVNDGKTEITNLSKETIESLKREIETVKTELIKKLDEYLLVLEEALKKNSDEVFGRVLLEAQSKIRDIKLAAQNFSNAAAQDLLLMQTKADESIDKVRNFLTNNQELGDAVAAAMKDDEVRDALIKFNQIKGQSIANATGAIVVPSSQSGVVVKSEPIIIPASDDVVIPTEEINTTIIRAFDQRIPLKVRMSEILDRMREREKNGEVFHPLTEEIIVDIIKGNMPYLWGPSGCGKTFSVEQIASLLEVKLVENTKITDIYSVMGYSNPQGAFMATQTYVATVYGGLLFYDEFDNSNPDIQVDIGKLQSKVANLVARPNKQQFQTFAEKVVVPVNPNFRMVCAGNTAGAGQNEVFSARSKSDEAVLQRITPKRFWYDNRIEKNIFGEYEAWYNLVVKFREACDKYAKKNMISTPEGVFTTRDATDVVSDIRDDYKTVDWIMREKFVQIKDPAYLKYLADYFRNAYDMSRVSVSQDEAMVSLGKASEKNLAKQLVLALERNDENYHVGGRRL